MGPIKGNKRGGAALTEDRDPNSEADLEVAGTPVFQYAKSGDEEAEGLTIVIYLPELASS
jgi:hypothetical protein